MQCNWCFKQGWVSDGQSVCVRPLRCRWVLEIEEEVDEDSDEGKGQLNAAQPPNRVVAPGSRHAQPRPAVAAAANPTAATATPTAATATAVPATAPPPPVVGSGSSGATATPAAATAASPTATAPPSAGSGGHLSRAEGVVRVDDAGLVRGFNQTSTLNPKL